LLCGGRHTHRGAGSAGLQKLIALIHKGNLLARNNTEDREAKESQQRCYPKPEHSILLIVVLIISALGRHYEFVVANRDRRLPQQHRVPRVS
jgi:hypothetical protein